MTNNTTNETKFFTITGTINFAHIKEPNTKGEYPSNKYELSLSIDKKTKLALDKLGVQIKNKDAKLRTEGKTLLGDFVTIRSTKQPKVLGTDGTQLTDIPLIGNGTTATITVSTYDNRESNVRAGKGGAKLLGLVTIKLHNLVTFEAKPLV